MKLRRILAASVVAVMMVAGLAACAVDVGAGAVDDLRKQLANVKEFDYIVASSEDAMPFSGTASAVVVLDDKTSDKRAGKILTLVGEFLRSSDSRPGVTWEFIDIQFGGIRMGVADTREQNQLRMQVLQRIRNDDMLTGALIRASSPRLVRNADDTVSDEDKDPKAPRSDLILTVKEREEVFDAFATASAMHADTIFAADLGVGARTDDEKFGIYVPHDLDREALNTPLAVYTVLSEKFGLLEATVTPQKVTARVESDDDVSEAIALAETIPGADELTISISGGIVTRDGSNTANGDAVAAATANVEGITSILITDKAVFFEIDDFGVASEIFARIESVPELEKLRILDISTTQDANDPSLWMQVPPYHLPYAIDVVEKAAGTGLPSAIIVEQNRAEFRFADATPANLSAFFDVMKPILLQRTQLGIGTESKTEWFTVGKTISADRDATRDTAQKEFVADIVEAWNNA